MQKNGDKRSYDNESNKVGGVSLQDLFDIVIIGTGPAGMSAAINAYARNKKVLLLSSGSNYLEKAENVDNYLGFPHISGKDLMTAFHEHVTSLSIPIQYGRVINVLPFHEQFMINFQGSMITAKTIIIATGVAKKSTILREDDFIGKGVSYCATCDGMLYKNKEVIVSGDANNIVEETKFLANLGAHVTVVGSTKQKEAFPPEISFTEGIITEILGENKVEAVRLKETTLSADGVFLLRNTISPQSFIANLQMQGNFIQTNASMETNIPGVYACGDCVGLPLQIAKATGEGLIAAQAAAKYLDTNKGV